MGRKYGFLYIPTMDLHRTRVDPDQKFNNFLIIGKHKEKEVPECLILSVRQALLLVSCWV